MEHYLQHKDRVGLVSFGGVLNWLLPATGMTQLYRIVDALLDTEIVLNYAWKDIDVHAAAHAAAAGARGRADPAAGRARGRRAARPARRGFDLAVVEISPLPFVPPGRQELERARVPHLAAAARRAARAGSSARASPVAVWNDDVPLVAALEEVRAFRRFARPAHA